MFNSFQKQSSAIQMILLLEAERQVQDTKIP
jgi:hypothetical protein